MNELPEKILVWIFEQDLIKYLATPVFLEVLRRSLLKLKSRKEKEKLKSEAENFLYRRN